MFLKILQSSDCYPAAISEALHCSTLFGAHLGKFQNFSRSLSCLPVGAAISEALYYDTAFEAFDTYASIFLPGNLRGLRVFTNHV